MVTSFGLGKAVKLFMSGAHCYRWLTWKGKTMPI